MSGYRRASWVAGIAVVASVAVMVPAVRMAEAATFIVDDTRDRVDSRPGNGVCRTSSGTCSLRAAIQEANARAGADVITFRLSGSGSRTYTITRAPTNDNDITTGDFDITGPLTINGLGRAATIIDGGSTPAGSDASRTALDRLFEIHPGAGDVTLSGLTVREGWGEKEGGAISSRTEGTLRLVDISVIDSVAGSAGGGIYFNGYDGGSIVIERSNVARNATPGEGGGIHLASGRLTITGAGSVATTVTANSARNGGGIYNGGSPTAVGQAARVQVTNATISANTALGTVAASPTSSRGSCRSPTRRLQPTSPATTGAGSPAARSRHSSRPDRRSRRTEPTATAEGCSPTPKATCRSRHRRSRATRRVPCSSLISPVTAAAGSPSTAAVQSPSLLHVRLEHFGR